MKIFYTLLLSFVIAASQAFAIDIDTAKEKGLVGERRDGYLGYVVEPPSDEVKALVKEVNNKRKAKFQATAEKTGITVEKVAARFYQLAVKQTESGHYLQDANGVWVKKP